MPLKVMTDAQRIAFYGLSYGGKAAMRISVSNWSTTEDDIEFF